MHRSSTVTARVGKRASDVIETTKLVHAEPTTHEKDCAGSVGRQLSGGGGGAAAAAGAAGARGVRGRCSKACGPARAA